MVVADLTGEIAALERSVRARADAVSILLFGIEARMNMADAP